MCGRFALGIKHRCVIPIQGYFEWLKSRNAKVPYYVHSTSSDLIYLAGFYSHNYNYPGDDYISSFTIITAPALKTDTNDISWLHDRKPVFLQPGSKEWKDWLDPNKPWDDSMIETCLESAANKAYVHIEGYPVSDKVGVPSNKGEDVTKRVNSQASISSFFQKREKKPEIRVEPRGVKEEDIKLARNEYEENAARVQGEKGDSEVKQEQGNKEEDRDRDRENEPEIKQENQAEEGEDEVKEEPAEEQEDDKEVDEEDGTAVEEDNAVDEKEEDNGGYQEDEDDEVVEDEDEVDENEVEDDEVEDEEVDKAAISNRTAKRSSKIEGPPSKRLRNKEDISSIPLKEIVS
ncbi:putative peptidase [Spathaspora sp. JA1]|nr:putative peptidase [Spathaspora sp. JA1]